jgi:hypothetical protein
VTFVDELATLIFIVAFVFGGFYLNTAAHEGAHALVALVMGLRVTKVRISFRGGHTAVVPTGRALPVRMLAMTLAGPLASFALAAALVILAQQPVPRLVHALLYLVAGYAVVNGVVNLVPMQLRRGRTTDGWKMVQWIFRPRGMTVATTVDLAQLARIIETTPDPVLLLSAFVRRWDLDSDRSWRLTVASRLDAMARDPHTPPTVAALTASVLATVFGTEYLYLAVVAGTPVDRATVDRINGIAELGARLSPNGDGGRVGLAIAALLAHRPAQARDLLAGQQSKTAEGHATLSYVFAIAEIYLGNRARADEVVAAAGDGAPMLRAVVSRLCSASVLPPLVQPDPAPAGPGAAHQTSST